MSPLVDSVTLWLLGDNNYTLQCKDSVHCYLYFQDQDISVDVGGGVLVFCCLSLLLLMAYYSSCDVRHVPVYQICSLTDAIWIITEDLSI